MSTTSTVKVIVPDPEAGGVHVAVTLDLGALEVCVHALPAALHALLDVPEDPTKDPDCDEITRNPLNRVVG